MDQILIFLLQFLLDITLINLKFVANTIFEMTHTNTVAYVYSIQIVLVAFQYMQYYFLLSLV